MSQTTADTSKPDARNGFPDVLTVPEAADYLRVSEAEIHDLVQSQGLPARKIGNEWRLLKVALQDWLRSPFMEKKNWMELAGAWKHDPYLDDMLAQIYEERGRAMAAESES